MNEKYLHQIWKQKRLPFHKIKLESGAEFKLIHQGFYNTESGPDFFCGQIRIDHLNWFGNIEIHVKSSDWYLHNHQYDKAYQNVILHVVYENDRQVFINERVLPTIELKKHIDTDHFFHSMGREKDDISCSNMIKTIDSIYIESMKNRVLIDRLNRKSQLISIDSLVGIDQILFSFLVCSFGNKVNVTPFFELSNRVDVNLLKRLDHQDVKVVILGICGYYQQEKSENKEIERWTFLQRKYNLTSMEFFQWKTKGVRPLGFPYQRIIQLIGFIRNYDFKSDFMGKSSNEIIKFIYTLFSFSEGIKKYKDKSFVDLIIINGFIPFIWWFSIRNNEAHLKEVVFEILSLLNPEKNNVVKKWKDIEVVSKKAFDSQALLEIYNEFCINKKCLSCSIGNKIFNK